jgi:hypothetical protein
VVIPIVGEQFEYSQRLAPAARLTLEPPGPLVRGDTDNETGSDAKAAANFLCPALDCRGHYRQEHRCLDA